MKLLSPKEAAQEVFETLNSSERRRYYLIELAKTYGPNHRVHFAAKRLFADGFYIPWFEQEDPYTVEALQKALQLHFKIQLVSDNGSHNSEFRFIEELGEYILSLYESQRKF